MTTVSMILHVKGHEVWRVTPDTSVFDALGVMAEKNVGALAVLEEDKLVGMFSERDYARKVILKGKSSKNTPVKEIMTGEVIDVAPDQSIDDCMALMTHKRVRHLPVLDGNKLVGVISIGDVVKTIISEQETLIEDLSDYITGRPR